MQKDATWQSKSSANQSNHVNSDGEKTIYNFLLDTSEKLFHQYVEPYKLHLNVTFQKPKTKNNIETKT